METHRGQYQHRKNAYRGFWGINSSVSSHLFCPIFSSSGPSIFAGVTELSATRVKYIQFGERAFSWACMSF